MACKSLASGLPSSSGPTVKTTMLSGSGTQEPPAHSLSLVQGAPSAEPPTHAVTSPSKVRTPVKSTGAVHTEVSPVQVHPSSTVHTAEQPSPETVLPSSHSSLPPTTPSPQPGV